MKTEQKQRLFALYWGQTVLSFKDKGKLKFEINAPNMWGKGINNQSDNAFLLLTHPNNITDEHCVELFDLLNKGIEKDYSVSEKVYDIKDCISSDIGGFHILYSEKIISFLRSKGYAFQCNGRSIKEQVESGDVELK